MRCMYRERRYFCGEYLELQIYPVYRQPGHRGKRAKPTSEAQAKLNEINAMQQLIRILNANYTSDDIEVHLTYRDDVMPDSADRVTRDYQNFIRRIKRLRKKLDLPEGKFVIIPAGGVDGTRYHIHITMSGGLDRSAVEELWGYGYANARRLQFNENGVEGLAKYVSRQFTAHEGRSPFGKRWSGSRNLIIPKPHDRDGKISAKRVKQISNGEAVAVSELLSEYPGYHVSEVKSFHNDTNGGEYLSIRLYKKTAFLNNKKRRREQQNA